MSDSHDSILDVLFLPDTGSSHALPPEALRFLLTVSCAECRTPKLEALELRFPPTTIMLDSPLPC